MKRPLPLQSEIKLSSKEILVSKTDKKGIITYGNDTFVKISGYSLDELIGANHNILRHPDMPKAIFLLMWDTIKKGDNITAVVKNLSKSGKFYWVITDFEIKRDKDGKIINYIAYRRAAPQPVIDVIEPIYKVMLNIEEKQGMKISLEYLTGILEEKGMTYNEFIADLSKPKGMVGILLNKMKKLFKEKK